MAVTKIIKVKANTKACIRYVTNDIKTENGSFVDYIGCNKDNAAAFFETALRNKQKRNPDNEVKAYHLIQSFAKTDDVSPEQAHEIGLEMMNRLFGGKYAFVCSTHVDKDHIHNHFVVCAAERSMTGKKLNDYLSLLYKIRRTSDQLCRENGLDVIEKNRHIAKHYKQWLEDTENPKGSIKKQLCNLIDEKIKTSTDFDDFISQMKSAGAEISFGNSKKFGRVTKYKLPNSPADSKWHRGYNLGAGYSDEIIAKRIQKRLDYEQEQEAKKQKRIEDRKAKYDSMSKGEKAIERTKLKIRSMVDTSNMDASSSTYGKNKWYAKQDAMRAEKIKAELRDKHGIDYTQIKERINQLNAVNNRYLPEIQKQKKSIESLRTLIEYCQVYLDTYPVNNRFNKSKNQEQYYQNHEDELVAYSDSIEFLKRAGIDLNKLEHNRSKYIEVLQKHLNSTVESTEAMEEQIKQNEKEIVALKKYQKELDIYFNRKSEEL